MTTLTDDLRERFSDAGQAHLFEHWSTLDEAGRARLTAQLESVDLDLVGELRQLLGAAPEAAASEVAPPDLFPLRRSGSVEDEARAAADVGAELLHEGRVGYVLVAGGQGSRLGFDGPKGAYGVGPVTDRSLFEMHARRLLAAARRYDTHVPWYVMTSQANDAATREFFAAHDHFGLHAEEITFFSQAMIPAMDFDGKLLLQSPDSLFLAPNGHGGVLAALASSGALADARERGLSELSYFQVDNPLARPADPLFLGLHHQAGASMSSKVVAKRDADEKVGVLGRVDGRMGCIEYSDLSPEMRHATDEGGELRFRAGNIAIHVLRVDFVEQLTRGGLHLPWHLAKKDMEVFAGGTTTSRKGAKFETFVFDALRESPVSVTLEVDRAVEFSPVKNASGADSAESCRRDLCSLWSGWAEASGAEVPAAGDDGVAVVEIDPVFAEDEHGFRARMPKAPTRAERGFLYD